MINDVTNKEMKEFLNDAQAIKEKDYRTFEKLVYMVKGIALITNKNSKELKL